MSSRGNVFLQMFSSCFFIIGYKTCFLMFFILTSMFFTTMVHRPSPEKVILVKLWTKHLALCWRLVVWWILRRDTKRVPSTMFPSGALLSAIGNGKISIEPFSESRRRTSEPRPLYRTSWPWSVARCRPAWPPRADTAASDAALSRWKTTTFWQSQSRSNHTR